MKTLRVILGDQLSLNISSLQGADKAADLILMCEVKGEAVYVKHHKKKIAFIFSAMRHFSGTLKKNRYTVIYTKLSDNDNTGTLAGEIKRAVGKFKISHVVVTQPGEYRVLQSISSLQSELDICFDIREDDRFLCSSDAFLEWVKDRKQLRMEQFYRYMRKDLNILMVDDKPLGDKWNYDSDNRKPPKSSLKVPDTYSQINDSITKEVLELVAHEFKDHFGDIDGFNLAVTRDQALAALDLFIAQRLKFFGDYQDAMIEGEPWMYHSNISTYLNCGLLLPLECAKAAEAAYHQGIAPLNCVEGFIRQIIGWREYVRGIYWLKMPNYADKNFFNATRALPSFYWTGKTKMNCLKQCVLDTKKNAYAHHIQRLMVLGNFALLIGVNPKHVSEWFLLVYSDAYEWVELPNVYGMALFADGGYLASKPYAAGGNYINKMSNYCQNCAYSVKEKSGAEACPFNYLYWHFLETNRGKLGKNQRLAMIYNTYDKMDEIKKKQILKDSTLFLANFL